MSANTTNAEKRTDTDLDERDVRALEQYLTVLPEEGRAADAPGLAMVVSQSGKSYLVDYQHGRCECPDAEYRDPEGGCKHVRRARYAMGEQPVPDGVDADPQLGAHCETQRAVADGGIVVAGDDGEIVDDKPAALPSHAEKLGVDGRGVTHYYSTYEDRVYVAGRDGIETWAIDETPCRHVGDWTEHVVDKRGRWQQLLLTERGQDPMLVREAGR